MIEKFQNQERQPETAAQVFERYCRSLELTPQDLENKKILDVGAGTARFARGLREAGIKADVISIDRNTPRENTVADPSRITMDAADAIHFPDNTFDYVISVSALPQVAAGHSPTGRPTGEIRDGVPVYRTSKEDMALWKIRQKERTARAIRECLRVVKQGGEVRFGGMPNPEEVQPFILDGFTQAVDECGMIVQERSADRPYILKKKA